MKPFLFGTLLLFSVASSVAQDSANLDHLMIQRFIRCEDVELNAVSLLSKYLPDAGYDSARMLVAYWIQRCGYTRENFQMELLLRIENGTFDESDYDGKLLNSLLSLRDPDDLYSTRHAPVGEEIEHREIHGKLNQLVSMLSRTLETRSNLTEYDRLLTIYIGGNTEPLLQALQENRLAGTKLQMAFNDERYRLENMPESCLMILLETWTPNGNLKILGTHPGLGFGLGVRRQKMTYDLMVSLRFLKTPDSYRVRYRDSLYMTNHFFGGYIGGEVGYIFYQRGKSEWRILGGIAFEGFDSLEPEEDEDEPSKSINTLNMNGGIGYRRFNLKTGAFIGLEARFNALNFNNAGGTNLDGNAITVRLTLGGYANSWKNYRRRALGLE